MKFARVAFVIAALLGVLASAQRTYADVASTSPNCGPTPNPANVVDAWATNPPSITGPKNPVCIAYDPAMYRDATVTGVVKSGDITDPIRQIAQIFTPAKGGVDFGRNTRQNISSTNATLVQEVRGTRAKPQPSITIGGCGQIYNDQQLAICNLYFGDGPRHLRQAYASDTQQLVSLTNNASNAAKDIDNTLVAGKSVPAAVDLANEAINSIIASAAVQGATNGDIKNIIPNAGCGNLISGTVPLTYTVYSISNECVQLFEQERDDAQIILSGYAASSNAEKRYLPKLSPGVVRSGLTAIALARVPDLHPDGTLNIAYQNATKAFAAAVAGLTKAQKPDNYYVGADGTCSHSIAGETKTYSFSATNISDATKKQTATIVVNCYSRIYITAGIGYSFNSKISYPVVQTFFVHATPGPSASPTPVFTSEYTISQQIASQAIAVAMAHYCLCDRPGDSFEPYFSLGYGTGTPNEIIAGLSAGWKRFAFLTLADNMGQGTVLEAPDFVGELVPQGYSPRTNTRFLHHFGISINFTVVKP